MNQIIIEHEENKWKINSIEIEEKFFITLSPCNIPNLQWWMDLPFAAATLNQENKFDEINYNFEDLIGPNVLGKSIFNFAKKFEINQAMNENGQEIIWNTQKGVFPIITWIKFYEDKKIIFLENRLEFIKLKNKAQEAQHLQILGQLASNIIHDFNNLLTSICGFTESLEEKMPNDESLLQIKRNVDQAAELSQELLNFIREKPIEQKLCEAKSFLPHVLTMLQKLMGNKINVYLENKIEGKVLLSELQLEQILLNMALNAKDVMPEGGNFTVKTSNKTFKQEKILSTKKTLVPGAYCLIEVIDTGTGISQENQEKIFSPFFTTKTKGTGLGLASCMRIAEHAGGGICFSTSSSGTVFSVYLPIATEEKKQAITSEKKILLVEDEETIRNLIQKSLQDEYCVKSLSNGIDAMQEINKEKFDLIITDAILPGIDGTQIAQKAFENDPNIKLLLISGYNFEDLQNKIPPTANYLGKPFTLKALKTKIKEIL